MKGEIFNLLEDFVIENMGVETYEEIHRECAPSLHTKEPFVGPGTYPDSDFQEIFAALLRRTSLVAASASRAFGRFCFPRLLARLPGYAERCGDPKTFLRSVHDVVHVEVRKVYRDAEPPQFTYRDSGFNRLIMVYKSKRRLYDFFEGLIDGVSDYYRVPIKVTRKIIITGDGEVCEFELVFGERTV